MKKVIKYILCIGLVVGSSIIMNAQETISADFKKSTIERLSQLMDERYVFPDVAKTTSAHIKKQLKSGHFNQFKTVESFAEALTKEVQSINKDKHMRIWPQRPTEAKENSMEAMMERQLHQLAYIRNNSAGFHEAKKLDGNVGYLDLRSFAPLGPGSKYADSYMQLLSTSDAIIVDLRKNGGGSPFMVQYLCSFFFDKKVHLNSLYFRDGDRTEEFWTLDEVNGEKMPDVPLFVLTSDRTFSGAEEFSYNMQTQKRATLVGQTTGGGANPGGTMPINEKLVVFIPGGKAINPITKTNWEGVGVVPEVKTSPEETLTKAHELAKVAAKEYADQISANQKTLLSNLVSSLESFDPTSGEQAVYKSLKKCKKAELMNEGMINGLGYEYLLNYKKPVVAEAIFKANTMLFPEIANVYDSYAEALAMNGKLKESAKNYQIAVEIGEATNDGNLELFKENLKKVKTKLNDKL